MRGDYELGALIGRGGSSEVYEATHRLTGETVAIKLGVTEAERTRTIRHRNVVEVIEVGDDFLVMERLYGEALRGPMSEADARAIVAEIADGIAAAHAMGIVHRDLKPGNVIVVGGVPKIVDFGIAREVADGDTQTRIGTPAYMAPEQLASGLVAPSIDVWAVGVMLYELVAGKLPFDTSGGASPQLTTTAPRLAGAYGAIVASCLQREPGRRPAMAEVARALRGEDEVRFTEDLGPVPRRRRWWIAVAALALIGGAIAWQLRGSATVPIAATVTDAATATAAAAVPDAAAATVPAAVTVPAAAPPRRHPHVTHHGSAAPRAGETLD